MIRSFWVCGPLENRLWDLETVTDQESASIGIYMLTHKLQPGQSFMVYRFDCEAEQIESKIVIVVKNSLVVDKEVK